MKLTYSNPYDPYTTKYYALPSSAYVRLTVHDMLGREIATLIDEQQSSGWKDVVWDAAQFANGICFYRLTAGNFAEIKRWYC